MHTFFCLSIYYVFAVREHRNMCVNKYMPLDAFQRHLCWSCEVSVLSSGHQNWLFSHFPLRCLVDLTNLILITIFSLSSFTHICNQYTFQRTYNIYIYWDYYNRKLLNWKTRSQNYLVLRKHLQNYTLKASEQCLKWKKE